MMAFREQPLAPEGLHPTGPKGEAQSWFAHSNDCAGAGLAPAPALVLGQPVRKPPTASVTRDRWLRHPIVDEKRPRCAPTSTDSGSWYLHDLTR